MRFKIVTMAATLMVVAACGDSGEGTPATAAAPATATAPTTTVAAGGGEAPGASVKVTGSRLGDIVTDEAGNTLYMFFVDTQGPRESPAPATTIAPTTGRR